MMNSRSSNSKSKTENQSQSNFSVRSHQMPGHVIRRLNQHSTQVFQARMQEHDLDLTSVQFATLDALNAQPGIDQARLASLVGYDRATIGSVIDRLEKKNLVQRNVSPRDRRAHRVMLTPAGEVLLSVALPIVVGLQDDILAELSPGERQQLVALASAALDL